MSFFRHGMPDGPGFPKVPVPPSIESFLSHSVGAAPLVAALCRDLGIPQLIDQEATWDEDRSILSPGERIMALIINLLCEERRPLYKVHDAFETLDTELLFGEGIRSDHLNDDCLGRALDAFYEIGPSRILHQVALSLRLKEAMDLPFVHFDTTTQVLYGAYGFEGSEEDPLDRLFSLPPSPRAVVPSNPPTATPRITVPISSRSPSPWRWTGIDPRGYLVPPVREKRQKVSKTPREADHALGKTPSAHPPPPPCESPPQTKGGHRDSLS